MDIESPVKRLQIVSLVAYLALLISVFASVRFGRIFQLASQGTRWSISVAVLTVAICSLCFFLPRRIHPKFGTPKDRWSRVYTWRTGLALSMPISAAIMNLCVCFVEQNLWSLVFIAIAAFVMMLQMPTRVHWKRWVEDESQRQEFEKIAQLTARDN